MSARVFIGLRLRPSGIAGLDEIAAENNTTRAAVIRACISLGFARKRELVALLKEDV